MSVCLCACMCECVQLFSGCQVRRVSYIYTDLSTTNLQPNNRISKEENLRKKEEIIQLLLIREELHTNGKFDDALQSVLFV